MVTTFVIDWPVLIALGLVFGALAPQRAPWRSRAFIGGLVATAVFTAVAVISYLVAPDWMWMYFLDPSKVAWSLPFVILGYAFFFVLAFAAALSMRRLGRSAIAGAIGVAVLLEVVAIALTWDRYHLVGTRAQWSAGRAAELFSASPDGAAGLIGKLGPVFLVVLALTLVVAWKGRGEAAPDR